MPFQTLDRDLLEDSFIEITDSAMMAEIPSKKGLVDGGPGLPALEESRAVKEVGQLSWWMIFKLNFRVNVALFLLIAVTLSIFPGFLAGECGCEGSHRTADQVRALDG